LFARLFFQLFDFLLFSNLFISICSTIITLQTFSFFDHSPNVHYIGFVSGGTLCSYNFHGLLSKNQFANTPKQKWSIRFRNIQVLFIIFGGIIAGFCFLQLRALWPWLILSIILTFLYSAPLIEIPLFRYIKKLAVDKTAFLAISWTLVTCLIPLLFITPQRKITEELYVFSRFFFIYAICILFDYRDRESDKIQGIISLVTQLSQNGIRFLFFTSLLGSSIITINMLKGFSLAYYFCFLLPVLILSLIFHFSIHTKSDYWYYFLLDGLMMLTGILLIIFGF
jgi:4-hydroxybenzoate polyprenyltransferase